MSRVELVITAVQRAQIAAAYLLGVQDPDKSLCCGDDRIARCAAIVGDDWADALREYFHEDLGCVHSDAQQVYYLKKIDKLTALYKESDDGN